MKKIFFGLINLFFCVSIFSQGIVIEGVTYSVDTLLYRKQAGPGVFHSTYRLPAYPLDFQVMEIDLTNPYNEIETVKALDRAVATERPTNMAIRKDAPEHRIVGGTNGDFYFYQDPVEIGIPRSGQFLDGEIIANPTGRASFVLGMNKKPYIDRLNFRATLINGASNIRIHTINMLRLEWEPNATNFLTLYTDKYGTSTSAIQGGTKVVIRPKTGDRFAFTSNDTVECIVEQVFANTGSTPIPAGKAVLHGRDGASTFLQGLAVGSEIKISTSTLLRTTPNALSEFKESVGGSDCIVLKNGTPTNEAKTAASGLNPRTGMGFSQDSTKVYMVVVDGRSTFSAGLDLLPFGELFKGIGAWNAVNLDGGGSSVMFVNSEVKNRPSDGSVRSVGNGVLVVSTAPEDDQITMIKPLHDKISLPRYGSYNPTILGYNQYGVLIDKDLKDVVLSVDPSVGEIRGDSLFFASGTENGLLTANYNGATATINVNQIADAPIKIRLDSVLLDNETPYPIEVHAYANGEAMELLPSALNWTVENPSVVEVTEGVVKGLSNGSSLVIGTLGDFKDTLKVNIEISPEPTLLAKSFADGWTITASSNLTNVSHVPTENGVTTTYTYAAGRNTNISYNQNFAFYSLPDTFKIVFNPGNTNLSKLVMRLKENNGGITVINKEFTGFTLNSDNVLSLPLDQLMDNPEDRGAYPLWFNFMQFVLNPTGMVAGQEYTIDIKQFDLIYKDVTVSIEDVEQLSRLRVYPNPVTNGRARIALGIDKSEAVKVEVYGLGGQLYKVETYGNVTSNEIELPLGGLNSGVYFVKVNYGNKTETVKIIIQ